MRTAAESATAGRQSECPESRHSTETFLLGAGRSGTTLLYKLMCLHPQIAYVSNYDKWAPTAIASMANNRLSNSIESKLSSWFNVAGNAYFVKRPLAKRVTPTPIEGEIVYANSGVPLIPEPGYRPDAETAHRLHDTFSRIRRGRNGKILLSKRTANNRRIAMLNEIFPTARFVHLIRDGRDVARSLSRVEWWSDHIVWWDGRKASEMEAAGAERMEICATNWLREVRTIQSSLAVVDPARILEVRFEALVANPVEQLRRITEFCQLDNDVEFENAINLLWSDPKSPNRQGDWHGVRDAALLTEVNSLLAELGYVGPAEVRES